MTRVLRLCKDGCWWWHEPDKQCFDEHHPRWGLPIKLGGPLYRCVTRYEDGLYGGPSLSARNVRATLKQLSLMCGEEVVMDCDPSELRDDDIWGI